MSHHHEKPSKICKQLRVKAREFLSSRKSSEKLMEIVRHFESGLDLSSCLLAVELIFTQLLKDKTMLIEIVPLKPAEKTEEIQYKEWLKNIYHECFNKIVDCLDSSSHKLQNQGKSKILNRILCNARYLGLSTAMNIISHEGKSPLESKGTLETYVPLHRLKLVLMKLLSNRTNNIHIINKYTEYLLYDDILFFTWKLLPGLTAKSNPNEVYILNYLMLLEKLQLHGNQEKQFLCGDGKSLF